MSNLQNEFIEFALHCQVLRFGQFTLKSGRLSPYFFNAGLFNHGVQLAKLGRFYAQLIHEQNLQFDMLFGPAYKGIPLASAIAISLANDFQRDIPFCFNRKEIKDHGEGGMTFGAPIQGKVLIVDDVITAGTSVNEAVKIIREAGGEPAGVVIALDRMEKGTAECSATQEVTLRLGIPVTAIINLNQLIAYLDTQPQFYNHYRAIQTYRAEYGVT